jgi:hypothetical protein
MRSQGSYDSRPDTYAHIETVREYLFAAVRTLLDRIRTHDGTKLVEPELSIFDEYTPKLRDTTYGSVEYKTYLKAMGEGLKHHYAHQRHHPEHFRNGIQDMTLIDVLEMLCDWKAATLRHADGDLSRSIEVNAERFGYGDEMKRLLLNTAKEMRLL